MGHTSQLGRIALGMCGALTAFVARAEDARPVCVERTRACLMQTVDAYFDGLAHGNGAAVPFANGVRVTEQGSVLFTDRAGFLDAFKAAGPGRPLRNRRMVVDTETGEVTIFALADLPPLAAGKGVTIRRAQRVRIVNGLISEVELLLYRDDNPAALWPDRP